MVQDKPSCVRIALGKITPEHWDSVAIADVFSLQQCETQGAGVALDQPLGCTACRAAEKLYRCLSGLCSEETRHR